MSELQHERIINLEDENAQLRTLYAEALASMATESERLRAQLVEALDIIRYTGLDDDDIVMRAFIDKLDAVNKS